MMTHNTNSLGLYISDTTEWIDSSMLFKNTSLEGCPFELNAVHTHWHLGWSKNPDNTYYKPFKISVPNAYTSWDKETLRRVFSHDIVHALDIFMRNEQHRLLEPDFGYPFISIGRWTKKSYELEVNVLAMQHAMLSEAMECTEYYIDVCTNLANRISDYGDLPDNSPENYVSNVIQSKFKYWKDNLDMLISNYKGLIDWCDTNKGRYDARKRFAANA
jgi:hypothetical protein